MSSSRAASNPARSNSSKLWPVKPTRTFSSSPRTQLDQTLKTTRHQGIAAELPDLQYAEPDAPFALAEARGETPLLILLDQITDPHNYGAIIRSAEVLGAHGVVTEERRSASLSAVVAKVSAGASSHLPLVQVKNLPRYMDELKERNVWLYGASGEASLRPEQIDWDRPAAARHRFGRYGDAAARARQVRRPHRYSDARQGGVAKRVSSSRDFALRGGGLKTLVNVLTQPHSTLVEQY